MADCRSLVENPVVVLVFWSIDVEGFVGMHLLLAVASLLDRELVQATKVGGDVGSSGQVQDDSCCCVLDCLEVLEDEGGGAGVEDVQVNW